MAKELNLNKNSYIYGILIISLLISILVGFFLLRPIMQDNTKQQGILDNRNQVLKIVEDKKSKLEELSSKTKDLQERAKIVNIAIPDTVNKKALIYQLYTIAINSGLGIDTIDDSTTASVSSDGTTSTNSNSTELTYTLSMSGSYDGLIAFLDYLKTNLRLISVNSINLSDQGGSLQISIEISAYTSGETDQNEQL